MGRQEGALRSDRRQIECPRIDRVVVSVLFRPTTRSPSAVSSTLFLRTVLGDGSGARARDLFHPPISHSAWPRQTQLDAGRFDDREVRPSGHESSGWRVTSVDYPEADLVGADAEPPRGATGKRNRTPSQTASWRRHLTDCNRATPRPRQRASPVRPPA
jgi:hypothetical protein